MDTLGLYDAEHSKRNSMMNLCFKRLVIILIGPGDSQLWESVNFITPGQWKIDKPDELWRRSTV